MKIKVNPTYKQMNYHVHYVDIKFVPKVPSFILARISFNPTPPPPLLSSTSMDLASAIALTTSLGVILTLDRGDASRNCFSIDLASDSMDPDLVKR